MEESLVTGNVTAVQDRIARSCADAGREVSEITLVAISKRHPPEKVRAAADAGLLVFGENKVQEAAAKIPQCPGNLTWHLVGHLQTNKVKTAVQLFDFIHSVDSAKLLQTLDAACGVFGKIMPVCLQINVSGEASKYGMKPEDLPSVLEIAAGCSHVDVHGLMTIPPFTEDPEKARGYFRHLAELKDRCDTDWNFPLAGLSMGMSHDLEIAIEEGATWVRVGTDIFGKREP